MCKRIAFALAALLWVTAARAEPARGFMVQAQLQNDLIVQSGLAPNTGGYSLLPIVRLGYSGRRLSAALEASYSTFVIDTGNSIGLHVIALGPSIQPVVWRSHDGNARLAAVVGGSIGGAIESNGSGTTSNENVVIGGFNVGLAGHFFPHPNFAAGLEVGVRVLWVDDIRTTTTTLFTVAALYAALSVLFVAGS
jgi:hypothetical protein